MKSVKNRNPFLAGLLSLITPGLGQIYNGQLTKGVILLICGIVVVAVMIMGILNTFPGLIFFTLFALLFCLGIIIDAVINARRLKDYRMKSFNRWYLYLLVIIIMCILNNFLMAFMPVKTYKMAGLSMSPTITAGERIVVNGNYYHKHQPARGDVIIFTPPDDFEKSFIKRVIAVGGEKLEIKGSKIFIDGVAIERTWAKNSGHKNETGLQNIDTFKIPHGTVFVLGDNFEHSYDSRHFGPIKFDSIKGKVLYIYWSKHLKTIGRVL